MRMFVHQQLENKMEEYGHTAQLNDMSFPSFRLHWGYRTPLSATDAVHAISALMESYATRPHENMSLSDSFWYCCISYWPYRLRLRLCAFPTELRLKIGKLQTGSTISVLRYPSHIISRLCDYGWKVQWPWSKLPLDANTASRRGCCWTHISSRTGSDFTPYLEAISLQADVSLILHATHWA